MDIATLLESHKQYFTELTNKLLEDGPANAGDLSWAHDRATIKALLDLYRSGNAGNGQQPVGHATFSVTNTGQPVTSPRRVKAGSKKARDRALKAGETRRKNLELKRQDAVNKSGLEDWDKKPNPEVPQDGGTL